MERGLNYLNPLTKEDYIQPDTIYCSICLNNCKISESVSTQSCGEHKFCRPCIESYLSSHIIDGEVSFKCPECSKVFLYEEVKALVPQEIFKRFVRFKQIKENPNYRECPKCFHSFETNLEREFQIKCSECGVSYCSKHSLAHPGISCKEYLKNQQVEEEPSKSLISRVSRPCPNCGCDTEKAGGCNHMSCRQCGEVITRNVAT